MPASNVTPLPGAANRKVDNSRWADQRRASLAARRQSVFADRYLRPQEREAMKLAEVIRATPQSAALLIVSAMVRAMDEDALRTVLEQLAPGVVTGSEVHQQALAVVRASRLNVGQQFDLMTALGRLNGQEARS